MLRHRWLAVACSIAAVALAGAGCSETDSTASSSAIRERVVTGEARWKTVLGNSLESMVANNDLVVVARVVGVEDISDLEGAGYDVGSTGPELYELQPGDPRYGLPTPAPYDPATDPPQVSRYNLEVHEVLYGDAAKGQVVPVTQSGGVRNGVAYETEGDPVIEVGKTYLLFLDRSDEYGWYWPTPWGRHELKENGKLEPVTSQWDGLTAQKELKGKSVDEAKARVAKAKGDLKAKGLIP